MIERLAVFPYHHARIDCQRIGVDSRYEYRAGKLIRCRNSAVGPDTKRSKESRAQQRLLDRGDTEASELRRVVRRKALGLLPVELDDDGCQASFRAAMYGADVSRSRRRVTDFAVSAIRIEGLTESDPLTLRNGHRVPQIDVVRAHQAYRGNSWRGMDNLLGRACQRQIQTSLELDQHEGTASLDVSYLTD